MPDPFDNFDLKPGRTFASLGCLALFLNLAFWGGLVAIILVALNVAGVI